MNHVGKGISSLPTLGDHTFHGLPGISVVFHCADDFQYCLNILYIFLDELGLSAIGFLFLYESVDSFFLVLFDLLIFFPSYFLKGLFLLVGAAYILAEILCNRFIEGGGFFVWILR